MGAIAALILLYSSATIVVNIGAILADVLGKKSPYPYSLTDTLIQIGICVLLLALSLYYLFHKKKNNPADQLTLNNISFFSKDDSTLFENSKATFDNTGITVTSPDSRSISYSYTDFNKVSFPFSGHVSEVRFKLKDNTKLTLSKAATHESADRHRISATLFGSEATSAMNYSSSPEMRNPFGDFNEKIYTYLSGRCDKLPLMSPNMKLFFMFYCIIVGGMLAIMIGTTIAG